MDPGIALRTMICKNPFGSKGRNGQRYGVLRARILTRKRKNTVAPMTNPGR